MVEWYIASGCTGLFAVCQSSEMYHMTDEERLAVARAVVKQADGRVRSATHCITFALTTRGHLLK
jgi:4-hydroxy-tetrahydrodipicolinate synthase